MKSNNVLPVGRREIILVAVIVTVGLNLPAYCQVSGPALLIQQTPAEAGTVSPEAGVHHFELNANVTLKAVARPGYQFVCWMGDVSQPTAPATVVRLDSPKIVVAVYECAGRWLRSCRRRLQSGRIRCAGRPKGSGVQIGGTTRVRAGTGAG